VAEVSAAVLVPQEPEYDTNDTFTVTSTVDKFIEVFKALVGVEEWATAAFSIAGEHTADAELTDNVSALTSD